MFIDKNSSISPEEQERFASHLYRYSNGAAIINEGQDDNALYLLREGKVAIEKIIGGKPTQISTIEAVNFFGEIAMIAKTRRSATVRVISRQAIVYKFQFVELKAIYANPAWTELLISRFTNDLIELNTRIVTSEDNNQKLVKAYQNLTNKVSFLFAALLSLQGDIAAEMLINSKDWKLVHGIRELTRLFIRDNLPEIQTQVETYGEIPVSKLSELNGVSEILKNLKQTTSHRPE